MQSFLNKYAIRSVLLIFSSYWLAQLASHTYHGLNDETASAIVSPSFVKAARASPDNYRNVKYLAITAMDMAVPYQALALFTAVRGSDSFVRAYGAVLALVTALGITWKTALRAIAGAEATASHLTYLDLLGVVALLAAFVFTSHPSPSPAALSGVTSAVERVWLRLHGYVGLCVVATIFVKPAGLWIVSLNTSPTANVMYHVVITHVFWESLLHLAVGRYASPRDAVAFYTAALARVLLSSFTLYSFADHAPDLVGLSSLLAVELLTLSFFVSERFRSATAAAKRK
jgi:hypothetical protein